MHVLGTIRTIETANFRVIVDAIPEQDMDLSFDETGEVAEKLDSGEYIGFCARARVIHKPTGIELGTDYLGGCIYTSLAAFQDHRECGKQNREREAKGVEGRCGSYFAGMIQEAIKEARASMDSLCSTHVGSYVTEQNRRRRA